MRTPTPAMAFKWSIRSVCVTGPLTGLTLTAWLFRWDVWLPAGRPFAVLMVYQALLLATIAGAAVALLAASHLAIHEAFRAGYMTGNADSRAQDERPGDPPLRAVE